jgi:hypothetical protein
MSYYEDWVEETRKELNATRWWQVFRRQEAAREYRWALYAAALHEMSQQ